MGSSFSEWNKWDKGTLILSHSKTKMGQNERPFVPFLPQNSKRANLVFIAVIIATLVMGSVAAAVELPGAIRNPNPGYTLSENAAFDITNLDEVVLSVRRALVNRSAAVHISVKLKGEYMDDISPFVNELMSLVFSPSDDPEEGDYLRFQMGGYTYGYGHEKTSGGYLYSITITPRYYSSLEQEEQTDAVVGRILDEIAVSSGASDYDKVRAVYDYLSSNVKYDLIHRNNPSYHLKSTAYGALVNHAACCQGYSTAMYRLLKELGVDCRIITGEGISEEGRELHSWNIVRIGEYYYNVDPTWNSNYTEKDYFLKCDGHFPDHIRDEEYSSEEFLDEYPMGASDAK